MKITLEVEEIDNMKELEKWVSKDFRGWVFNSPLLSVEFFEALGRFNTEVKFKKKRFWE